jgi:hypothetical protein
MTVITETFAHAMGLAETAFKSLRTHVRSRKGSIVDYQRILVRNGRHPSGPGDQRCKRAACVYPRPVVRFDLEGGRIVATWNWFDVAVVVVPSGVRVTVQPALLLVPISCN